MEKINLKFISLVAFIISLVYTCKLMLTNSSGVTDQILTLGTACVLEFSKCAFLYKSLNPNKLGEKAKIIMGIIGSFLFLVSICASLAFLFNQANETYNKNIISSKPYQQKFEIIQDVKNQRDMLPLNYPTKKIELNKEIERLTKELNSEFKLKSVTGYQAFFQVVADMIAKEHKQEPLTANKLQLLFFAMISITFEVTAIFLFYLSEKEQISEEISEKIPGRSFEKLNKEKKTNSVEDLEITNQENGRSLEIKENLEDLQEKKENLEEEKEEKIEYIKPLVAKKNKIGFRFEEMEEPKQPKEKEYFTEEEKNRYKKFMIEDAKERKTNVAISYKVIAESVGISQYKATKIIESLKDDNIIRVDRNKTYILNL